MSKIIVAPLNWGIGHATRCIPIINELIEKGFEPIIASDGDALIYLKKEFPLLKWYELPSYDIKYSKKSYLLKITLLLQIPKIKKAVANEYRMIQQIVKKEKIQGIISDNRFGVRSKEVPSVYISHQLQVFSGIGTFITSWIHQKIMKKFDIVWIPDDMSIGLSGKLTKCNKLTTKYIGVLSRFQKTNLPKLENKYDVLVLLSGTEPQRSILENKMIKELKKTSDKVVFVRGTMDSTMISNTANITFINFLHQKELLTYIVQSKLVIARSGYSTIMDLAVLKKKCFFIPTPSQSEQEYLAKHLEKLKIAPFASQSNFSLEKLSQVKNYNGFVNTEVNKLQLPLSFFNKTVK